MLKVPLVTGEIYHVYNKSIAEFVIFNNDTELLHIKDTVRYYQIENQPIKFSKIDTYVNNAEQKSVDKKLVEIICYCFMPTHIHLVLRQLMENGISNFMRHVLSSYSHYFNIKHNRKGPLWESSFKKVLVENDAQLLHLTRYIHLNPATAYIVNNPEDWKWSSYREYIFGNREGICEYDNILDIKPEEYKKFTEDRIFYQRELAKIKGLLLD